MFLGFTHLSAQLCIERSLTTTWLEFTLELAADARQCFDSYRAFKCAAMSLRQLFSSALTVHKLGITSVSSLIRQSATAQPPVTLLQSLRSYYSSVSNCTAAKSSFFPHNCAQDSIQPMQVCELSAQSLLTHLLSFSTKRRIHVADYASQTHVKAEAEVHRRQAQAIFVSIV